MRTWESISNQPRPDPSVLRAVASRSAARPISSTMASTPVKESNSTGPVANDLSAAAL